MVNLDLYRIFYTVGKCGSLTKAAEELYISQPAVSQAIKQLESQLGTTLFNRTHKGMELSAQGGELIFADVVKAMDLLDSVEGKLAELKHNATGTLRIGASETIFRYLLADKIVEYHKVFPQVNFELLSDITPKTIEQIKSNRCDIGFLNLPMQKDEDIDVTPSVMLLSDVFIAGNAYEGLKGKELPVWELATKPLIFLESGTVARAELDHYFQRLGLTVAPIMEIDSWELMKKLVVEGMGIGCIPREYIEEEVKSGSLFELNVTPSLAARSVGFATAKNKSISFALRAFINLFQIKT